MAFLHATGDFINYSPGMEVIGAKLITVDAENVITAAGDPTLRPGALEKLEEFGNLGTKPGVAIATNNEDDYFVDGLSQQLPDSIPVLSGLDYQNKKLGPGMFLGATSLFEASPGDSVHVDDQYLSFRGAREAGYRGGLFVLPYGSTHHKGVKVGRVFIDYPAHMALTFRQDVRALGSFLIDGIDG